MSGNEGTGPWAVRDMVVAMGGVETDFAVEDAG